MTEYRLLEDGWWDGFDKRDEFRSSDEVDLGWIGEDKHGVWITKHPHFALYERPALWPIYNQWQNGLRKVDRAAHDKLSAYHYSALLVLHSARSRIDYPGGVEDGDEETEG